MKILFIVPGAGDSFYCGNCFRDSLQAHALRKAGHEVVIMPLYLPLTNDRFKADTPLFFPAPAFYVAEKLFRNRRMPQWIEKLLSSNRVLRMASSLSGATSAEGMEDITLSMIYGEDAVFQEQVSTLVSWIEKHEQPDTIHLSSSLLIGIAKAIKQRVSIPIVCSLQDEEIWIDSLQEKFSTIAWKGIVQNLPFIDRFVTTSEYYKQVVSTKIPQTKNVAVIYPGIDREAYRSEVPPQDPTIGFFYRMNKENGLDILAGAFVLLKKRGSIPSLKLKLAGGYTGTDKKFLKQVRHTLSPYMDDVDWSTSYDLNDHAAFFKQVTVVSVPVTFVEGVGLYICEAFAAGCPVVEPNTGSFGEIVGNAGILYDGNNSESLANALEEILTQPELLAECRKNAIHLSETRYNDTVMAEKLIELYHLPA